MKQRQVSLHLLRLLRVSLLDSQVWEGDWALLATPSIPRFSPITFWDTEATSFYLKHSSLNIITIPMQHQCSVNSCQFFWPPCPGWIISGLLSTSKHPAKSSILKIKRPSFDSSSFPSQHPTSSHYVLAGIPSTLAVPFIQHFILYLTPCKLASASPVLITTTIPPPQIQCLFLVVTLLIFPEFSSGPEHRCGSSKWPVVISLSC